MTHQTEKPKIWVDFHNSDALGRVRLNTVGTIENLNNFGLVLRRGLNVTFYCFEREQDGEVAYSEEEHLWVGLLKGKSRDLHND